MKQLIGYVSLSGEFKDDGEKILTNGPYKSSKFRPVKGIVARVRQSAKMAQAYAQRNGKMYKVYIEEV